jgi:hypothetical protein
MNRQSHNIGVMKTMSSLKSKVLACLTMAGLLSTPISGFSARDVAAASEPQPLATVTSLGLNRADGMTFSATMVCRTTVDFSPFVILEIVDEFGVTGRIPWLPPFIARENTETLRVLYPTFSLTNSNMSEDVKARLLRSKSWTVTIEYSSCSFEDTFTEQNMYSTVAREFDGPRVEFGAKSLSIRQGTAPSELESMTHTFSGGLRSLREGGESLFSVEPICSVIDNEGEVLSNADIAQLESGDSREISCAGGALKESEAWRANSFAGSARSGAGRLHILGEGQWALAADHFSSFGDEARFSSAKVPLVLPAGANDAVYVLSEHGEGPPNRQELSSMQIGALVGSNGKSLSADFCSVNHGSAIATSPTSRIAVGAGMSGTGSYGDAELVRFSFDENSAQCDYVYSDRVPSPIRSLVMEDADNVLALHGTTSDTISRITFPDIVADPDAEFEPAPQQDFAFASNLRLQAIVTDSRGKLWGVSQLAGDITIWELTLVPPVLSDLQTDPIFNDASWSNHSFTIQDDDAQEQEPPVGTVTAEEWLTFDADAELLVGFEARGNILTVSTWDNYSWSYFTSVRSFDSRNKSVVAQMQSNPGDDCDDFFGIEDSCGGYLLGVDERNGAAILGDYGDLGRTGPSASQAVTQLSEAWTFFGSDYANRGTLSNDGQHAWLFNSDDAKFERVALTIPGSSAITEDTGLNPGAAAFAGPMIPAIQSPMRIGSEVVLRGNRLGTISSLKIGEVTQTLTSRSDTELRFTIAASTKPGLNDIVLVSSFGTMRLQSHIHIEAANASTALGGDQKSPLMGTTKMLSRSAANNQRWFAANLPDSNVPRILCTALVRVNATAQQKRNARTLARTTCAQAAEFLDSPRISVRVRETRTQRMPGRVMIGFREAPTVAT